MSLLQREVVRGFREKKHREWSVFSVVEESVWKGVVSGFLQSPKQQNFRPEN